jgi:PAT family beta-lactamase induction signal transducer AmpG
MSDPKASAGHPAWWVPSLYFAEGLPFFAISLIAGLLYKRRGVPNDVIALYTSWLLLPWSLKPLWSPLLEMFRTKKFFVILTQLLGGVSLALIALVLPLPDYFRYTLALFSVVAFCSSTHDIAADGLYIASLSQKDQAAYAGWQGGFYNVARFFSQGGLVILAGPCRSRRHARLDGDLGAMGLIMVLLGLITQGSPAGPSATAELRRWRRRSVTSSRAFLKQPNIWLLLVFILLYRAGEGRFASARLPGRQTEVGASASPPTVRHDLRTLAPWPSSPAASWAATHGAGLKRRCFRSFSR